MPQVSHNAEVDSIRANLGRRDERPHRAHRQVLVAARIVVDGRGLQAFHGGRVQETARVVVPPQMVSYVGVGWFSSVGKGRLFDNTEASEVDDCLRLGTLSTKYFEICLFGLTLHP